MCALPTFISDILTVSSYKSLNCKQVDRTQLYSGIKIKWYNDKMDKKQS